MSHRNRGQIRQEFTPKGIQHDGGEREPSPGNDVSDVCLLEPVRCVGGIVALDRVRHRPVSRIPYRRSRPLAPFQYPEPEATLPQPSVR